jgi:tripartite-type tricarboxylate transporter receptor subunit TctC
VPYKAVVDAQVDLMGGRIQVMFTDFTSSVPLIKDGRMRALGVTTKTRAAAMPDLQPIAELGVPGFDAAAWQMVVAPSAVPRPVADKLHNELEAIMALPGTRESITRLGLVPAGSHSIEELQTFVRSEIVRWGEVVKRSGASVD